MNSLEDVITDPSTDPLRDPLSPRFSIDDPNRRELLWTQKSETLTREWIHNIEKKIRAHNKSGQKNKRMYMIRLQNLPSLS